MSLVTARRMALAVAAIAGCALFESPAEAHSSRVRTACTSDYLQFCSQYNPDSFQTTNCMRRNQKRLSGACRSALVAEGLGGSSGKQANRQR